MRRIAFLLPKSAFSIRSSKKNSMEVKVTNDGLLTNLEVVELIKERRRLRLQNAAEKTLQIDAQHREFVEQQVSWPL